MKKCPNHPAANAYYVCHACSQNYCTECLTERNEFYYCSKPECQKIMESDNQIIVTICPGCASELQLEGKEIKSGIVECIECGSRFIFETSKIIDESQNYTEIVSTFNQGDIALIKSLFESAQIDYYIAGENFVVIDPMIQPARFYIKDEQYNEAKNIVENINIQFYGVSIKRYKEGEE